MQTEKLKNVPPHDDSESETTVIEDLQQLWQEVRALSHDHFQLAALESQQAGISLVAMISAGILVAFFFAAACLGLLAFAVLVMIEQGVTASNAILLAVSLNLILVLIFLGVIRRKSRDLKFSAFLRSLQPSRSRRNSTGNN